MLVHSKIPRGILHLDRFRIHGKETGYPPCDIPFDLYNKCKDGLQDATYREGFLSVIFKTAFPEVAFTYSELRYLPEETLDRIGPLMIDKYDSSWSHKKKVDQIKLRLAEISPCR